MKYFTALVLALATILSFRTSNAQSRNEHLLLHCNKNVYSPKDTIFFKAYLYAIPFEPVDSLSKVLHVELFSSNKKIIQKQQLYLEKGQAMGCIPIKNVADTTVLFLRVYTKFQRNFGDTNLMLKPILVCSNSYTFRKKNDAPVVAHFVPHSGNLIEALPSMVDVVVTDFFGNILDATGTVIDQYGVVAANFDTKIEEKRHFLFVPVIGNTYTSIVNVDGQLFKLPFIAVKKTGASLYAADSKSDTVLFKFYSNFYSRKKIFSVQSDMEKKIIAEDTSGRNVLRFAIPTQLFPQGYSLLVVEDEIGETMAQYVFKKSGNFKYSVQYDSIQKTVHIRTNSPSTLSLAVLDTIPDLPHTRTDFESIKSNAIKYRKQAGVKINGIVKSKNASSLRDMMVMNAHSKDVFFVTADNNAELTFEDNYRTDTLVYWLQSVKPNRNTNFSFYLENDTIPLHISGNPYFFTRKPTFDTLNTSPQNIEPSVEKAIYLAEVKVKGKIADKYVDNRLRLFKADYTINKDEIRQRVGSRAATNLTELLVGRVPGLESIGGQIRIRGAQSFQANTPVLILIDNLPADQAAATELMANWPIIEKIEVAKSLSSTTLYGMKGAGGIVAITTKNLLHVQRINNSGSEPAGCVVKVPAFNNFVQQCSGNSFWYPSLNTDNTNTISVSLKSIRKERVCLQFEGINKEGHPFRHYQMMELH